MSEEEPKKIEVSLKFYLPDHEYDFIVCKDGSKYRSALNDIYAECRKVWKYDHSASEAMVDFSRRIGEMAWLEDI